MEARTLFQNGFRREPWSPSLGQFDFGSLITGLVTGGVQAYAAYQSAEAAERQRKAADAKAAAAQAAADAAKAEAAAATAEAERRKANADAITAQEQGALERSGFLGIPTPYLLVGGAALAAIAIIFSVTK